MAFHKITWNEKYGFATLHNYGCTFHCAFCSYKLRSGANGRPGLAFPAPTRFLDVAEQQAALRTVKPARVYFMGGEPTVAPELGEMLRFARHELGATTRLGHTNGSKLPLPDLDGANVGFKAWSEKLHEQITGRPKKLIYDNFAAACAAGLDMAANMVYVPGLVELDEFAGLMRFLSALNREIRFHIMGYIPVPGQPFRAPTAEEIQAVETLCRSYLTHVASSRLSSAEALDLACRDDRFQVKVIAGA